MASAQLNVYVLLRLEVLLGVLLLGVGRGLVSLVGESGSGSGETVSDRLVRVLCLLLVCLLLGLSGGSGESLGDVGCGVLNGLADGLHCD